MLCPDENQLLAYVGRTLGPGLTATIEQHVDDCPPCCELLASFARSALTEPPDSAAPPASDEDHVWAPGATLGRYIILYPLGVGGMGVVYAAFDPELDRNVAIKVIRPDLGTNVPGAQARLAREARAAARLSHPNVVVVYDVGPVGNELFIAMELVTGGSLAEWLAAERRGVREIVATFVQAGRGLAAAHAAGLVHRDFKPANVLVAADGQVRVTDFGLARAASPAADPTTSTTPDSDASLTLTGAIAGTPAYMSLEQHRGEDPGAASDQFSFCVSLHEALYGVRPFAGSNAAEIAQAIEAERLVAPRATAPVPSWLRRLVVRGLARDPVDRHPSMTAVVHGLERGLSARRRQLIAAALTVGVLAVAGSAVITFAAHDAAPPICASAAGRLDGVWDAAIRQRVATAFGTSARPYAPNALLGATQALDTYATGWLAAHQDACEAANIRHDQSSDVLDLRMICLDRHLGELHALADLLTRADDHVIEKAAFAASELPALAECANVERLKMPVRPPSDLALRARVEGLHDRLAEIEQLSKTDHLQEGLSRATELVAAATQTGFQPVIASSLEQLGGLQFELGHGADASATLEAAELAAEAAGDITAAAGICSALISVVGADQNHPEAGHAWARRALALLERLGGDEALEATIRRDLATLLASEGKLDEAQLAARRALDLEERVFGPTHIRTASALHDLAEILARRDKLDDARALLDRALAIKQREYGPSHSEVATTLGALGELDSELGRYDDALREAGRSLEIYERAGGPENPAVAFALTSLSDIARAMGNYEQAQRYAERARTLTEKIYGPDHPRAAETISVLGTIAGDLGHLPEAEALYRRALAIREQALGPDHVAVASSLTELATIVNETRPRAAIPLYERALAIEEHALGTTNPVTATPLTGLGETYLALHDSVHAAAALERALAIRTGEASNPFDVARIQFDLARALWDANRERSRAHQLAATAREVFGTSGVAGHLLAARSASWLAAHPAPASR